MCRRRSRVVIERVGGQEHLAVLQTNVIIEHRHLRIGMIFAPVTG